MATNIFLGYPPENIKQFIIDNYGPKEDPMLKVPLHFTAEQDGSSVSLVCYDYIDGVFINSWCEFEYSMTGKDDDWSEYTTGQVVPLNEGETVYFRCPYEKDDPLNQNKDGLCKYEDYGDGCCEIYKYHFFKMEGSIKADGNIQFLLDKTGTMMEAPAYCYYNLFFDSTSETGYNRSLTQAPKLPATTLASGCYSTMFSCCSSLTQAPALPATTLADNCYSYMFSECISLTQAPELPATTLADNCYFCMFYCCESLNNVNVSFSDWSTGLDATIDWLIDVAAEGTFTCPDDLPEERSPSNIPEGWTIVRK